MKRSKLETKENNNMLKGIIVEHEKKDAGHLENLLNRLQPKLSCAVFSTGAEALAHVKRQEDPVDIFFIARELPGMDGFSLLSRIRQLAQHALTPVVFVTGDELGRANVLRDYRCYSYLVKPLSEKSMKDRIGALLETLGQQKKTRRLKRIVPLTVEGDTRLVEAQSILGLETAGKNCYMYAGKNKYRILRRTIDETLEEINEPYCIRCHKSFALNLRNVIDIKKERRNIWIPVFSRDTDFQCEISRTHYEAVMERFHIYLSGKQ